MAEHAQRSKKSAAGRRRTIPKFKDRLSQIFSLAPSPQQRPAAGSSEVDDSPSVKDKYVSQQFESMSSRARLIRSKLMMAVEKRNKDKL